MRHITIKQDQQADGSIHHQATCGCSLEPCSKIYPESYSPESCDYLHSDGVDGEGQLRWMCNKPPCAGGD